MKRTLRQLSRVAAMAGLLVACGASPVSAQAPRTPLPAYIVLDGSTPQSGEEVTTDRIVGGHVQALEGVRSVSLYVVPAGMALDVTAHRPESTSAAPLSVHLDAMSFRLPWRPGSPREVDLYVVAVTWLRELSVVVPAVRISRTRGPSLQLPRTAAESVRHHLPARRDRGVSAPDLSGLGVFHGGFATDLPYAATASAAVRRGRSLGPLTSGDAPRSSPWSSLSVGLVLLLGSAHVHRALRTDTTSRGEQ